MSTYWCVACNRGWVPWGDCRQSWELLNHWAVSTNTFWLFPGLSCTGWPWSHRFVCKTPWRTLSPPFSGILCLAWMQQLKRRKRRICYGKSMNISRAGFFFLSKRGAVSPHQKRIRNKSMPWCRCAVWEDVRLMKQIIQSALICSRGENLR